MIQLTYDRGLYSWVLDSAALSEQERYDLMLVRGAYGSFRSGQVGDAVARLAEAEADVMIKMRLDGPPFVYVNGTLI
jgi:hypothetical protein